MIFSTQRGRARRVSGSSRRRVGRLAPSQLESLEDRRLLAAGNFGINVEITPFTSYVNLLQTPGDWTDAPGDTNTIVLNSSNDPESDAALVFDLRVNQAWNGPDPNAVAPNLAGTYHLSFHGEATVEPEYGGWGVTFTVANQTYNASTNTTTADLVVPTGITNDFFGISFLNTQATATSPVNTGISNAVLIRPGYAAGSTQLYTNEFLAALKPYSTLRYLDDDGANTQPYFNGNTLVTVDAPQVDQTGQPWEYLIALANASQTDMWINIPQGATNAYVTALAGIFKNGGTVNGVSYPGLDSNLKIYLEYSNEVWGGIQANEWYQNEAVQNLATNDPLSTFPANVDVYNNVDGSTTTDYNVAVGRRYLEETANIGQIFQSVLGSDPTHQRIRPVLGWQENNFDFWPGALDWYQHFFGSASAAFYGIGDANYMNPTDYTSVNSVISTLQAQITSDEVPEITGFTALATYYGLADVSYEGGPSIGADGTTTAGQNALAASRDPRMEQLVLQEYETFYASGGTLAMYFDGPYAQWTPLNEWGAAELAQYGNPTAAAKYRGTVDVANAAPVAVTGGIAVTASSPTTFATATDSIKGSFSTPYTGQQNYWLLNVASAGSYDLKLNTLASGGSTPGQIEVFVDDKQVGGILNVANQAAVVDLGNLALSAGLNTLSIYVVHGQNDPAQSHGVYYTFNTSSLTLTPSNLPAPIIDPGFEEVSVGNNSFQYDPTGSAWVFSGSAGLSANGSGFTSSNPVAPQGSQVAFLQQTGSITQTVVGWAAGTYTLSFDAAQRVNSQQNFEVLVDGNMVGTFKPSGTSYQIDTTNTFTVASGSHIIEFLGLDTAGGDNTTFLDNVSDTVTSSSTTVPTVGDSGFEEVNVGYGFYRYDPTGSAWTFASSAGVANDGSGFTAGNPVAPQGQQVAFLQQTGSITQSIASWAAGTYTISFDAAQRGNQTNSQEDFEVLVDGNVVGTFKPTSSTYLIDTTNSFTVASGAHSIEFLGLDTVGGDNTALLDNIAVASTATGPAVPTVGDSGFEEVNVGFGFFRYDPTGSAWTFVSSAGVANNGSGFTGGNPAAPQGQQVAFLQQYGSITQSVANWAAGTYTISFDAAQRGNETNSQEDFEVLVDGNVVGVFKPTGSTYQLDTTASFTVLAGTHIIEFLGLDSVGGDNTALIDNVTVAVASGKDVVFGGNGSFDDALAQLGGSDGSDASASSTATATSSSSSGSVSLPIASAGARLIRRLNINTAPEDETDPLDGSAIA